MTLKTIQRGLCGLLFVAFYLSSISSFACEINNLEYVIAKTQDGMIRTLPEKTLIVDGKRQGLPISLDLSQENQYLLQKLQIQNELQDNILKWAQSRFWIIAVLSVIIGFFGVRALVREMVSTELKDATRASAEAQAMANLGRDVVKEVRVEAIKI